MCIRSSGTCLVDTSEKAQYPEWLQRQEERRAELAEERRNREILSTCLLYTSGTAVRRELYLGKYEVREITAPHGMVLNPEPIRI